MSLQVVDDTFDTVVEYFEGATGNALARISEVSLNKINKLAKVGNKS